MALYAGAAVAAAASAVAQMPAYPPPPPAAAPLVPASPQASEIATCLCMYRDMQASGAEMTSRRAAYDQVRRELDDIDARLARQRQTMNVNDPAAVAGYRQLLGQRDAAFKRSTGPVAADLSRAVAHYNGMVNQYNARCANQPRNPELLAQVQSGLVCPAR